jgi:hypothetical protein
MAQIKTCLSDADTFRKILSFASSAGDTITNRDAIEVIRSLCHERLGTSDRAAAVVRHVERVRALLEDGRRG